MNSVSVFISHCAFMLQFVVLLVRLCFYVMLQYVILLAFNCGLILLYFFIILQAMHMFFMCIFTVL